MRHRTRFELEGSVCRLSLPAVSSHIGVRSVMEHSMRMKMEEGDRHARAGAAPGGEGV